MKKFGMAVGIIGLVFISIGCSNKGDEIADDINKQVVEKIDKGEIKTIEDAKMTAGLLMLAKMLEMKEKGETMTESEGESMKNKIKEYEKEWEELIKKKKK